MWVRASELWNNLDSELYSSVKTWINEVWPFSRPAYPGSEITIEDWNKIPDEPKKLAIGISRDIIGSDFCQSYLSGPPPRMRTVIARSWSELQPRNN